MAQKVAFSHLRRADLDHIKGVIITNAAGVVADMRRVLPRLT
jgi:hypothetical protein